jgi:hypothetical protein
VYRKKLFLSSLSVMAFISLLFFTPTSPWAWTRTRPVLKKISATYTEFPVRRQRENCRIIYSNIFTATRCLTSSTLLSYIVYTQLKNKLLRYSLTRYTPNYFTLSLWFVGLNIIREHNVCFSCMSRSMCLEDYPNSGITKPWSLHRMSIWLDIISGRSFPSNEREVMLLGFVINEGKFFWRAFNSTSNGTRHGLKWVCYYVCRKMRWTPFDSDGDGSPNWLPEYSRM